MAGDETGAAVERKESAGRAGRRVSGGRTAVRLDGAEAHPVAVDQKAPVKRRVRASRRGEDVRQRVLKSALECFGAFGFEGTSTRAVAEHADVTHTLVLYHFHSKEQLWIATIDNALSQYRKEMEEHLSSAGESAAMGLRTFIEQFVRMSARQPQIHRILTMESNQDTTRLNWVIENYLRRHFAMVRDLIRAGQEQGLVRQCDPARLYYMIIGAGGTQFTVSTEYKALTGRDVFSETEILRNIAFLYELVFIDAP